jgi:hypothetical protein
MNYDGIALDRDIGSGRRRLTEDEGRSRSEKSNRSCDKP